LVPVWIGLLIHIILILISNKLIKKPDFEISNIVWKYTKYRKAAGLPIIPDKFNATEDNDFFSKSEKIAPQFSKDTNLPPYFDKQLNP
jgi:hypothetical protein